MLQFLIGGGICLPGFDELLKASLVNWASQGMLVVKNLAANVGNMR